MLYSLYITSTGFDVGPEKKVQAVVMPAPGCSETDVFPLNFARFLVV